MSEVPNHEMLGMLPQAVEEVKLLYIGDQLSDLLGTQPPNQRHQFWQKAAQEFGPFSENIIALRRALMKASITKRAYPASVIDQMTLYFSKVKDPQASMLLTDLFLARTTVSSGYIDSRMEVGHEAVAMASELASKEEGLGGNEMESVTFDRVIELILLGRLKLTRQTQLDEK